MTESHKNHMNGESFDITNPIVRLRVAASSCFFGEPSFYEEKNKAAKLIKPVGPLTRKVSLSVAQRNSIDKNLGRVGSAEWGANGATLMLEKTIDAALDFDVEATLAFAAELRTHLRIRKTPQVIMVRAANHPKVAGTTHLRTFGNKIMKRLDDAMVQAEYQLTKFGKPIPSRLKRAWARRLESSTPYELAKYRREGHLVNLYDLVNISHPKASAQPALNELMTGKLKLGASTGDIKTWESVRAEGGTWADAATEMGHMALLRNLRNLAEDGIVENYLDKLKGGVEKGNQLPFRYFSAYRAVSHMATPKTLEAIEDCIDKSILAGIPHFHGKVMHLSDNSGSAWQNQTSEMGTMKTAEIGNLMSVIGAKAADEGYVGVFGNRLIRIPIKPSSRTFDALQNVSAQGQTVGMNTENGIWLFWEEAIRTKEKWNHIFVWSDMQAGHGGLYGPDPKAYKGFGIHQDRFINVPKLIAEYRKQVNPDVMVYLVQTAGYEDTLVPEFYDKTFILGGWSEQIFHFAAEMNEIFG